ncbi:hypothetical protein KQI65_08405 [bacterium]|nr:hypothetical protein [bacterium]
MFRHGIIALLLFLPVLSKAQAFDQSITAPLIAELHAEEPATVKAPEWSGSPASTPSHPAAAVREPVSFRGIEAQPVFDVSGSLGNVHEAALHVFTGVRFGNFVQLEWKTTTHNASVGFELERRTQSHPTWERIEYFRNSVRQRVARNYVFNDRLHDDGVVYYRLRQIGARGTDIVSPVISVTPDNVPKSFSIWKNSSMPFENYGSVSFGLDQQTDVTLTLLDRFGQPLRTLLNNAPMEAGHHIIPFGTAQLQPGLYFLRITTVRGSENLILLQS